jgi:hypothetical protein
MRKTVLTLLGGFFLVASAIQIAAAASRDHKRKTDRAPPPASRQVTNDGGPTARSIAESDAEYWAGRGFSPPAGH